VTDQDQGKHRNDSPRHWARHAITVILLLALIVTGVAAYFARQQWWEEMYRKLTH
jgi:hypothetical protein